MQWAALAAAALRVIWLPLQSGKLLWTALGLLQFTGPTIQRAVGVWVFGDPFTSPRRVGFAAIWLALVIYPLDGGRVSRLVPTPA